MPDDMRDPAHLFDMIQAGEKVRRYLADVSFEVFLRDEILTDAVGRNLTILGEAARRVSDAFKLAHPEIPWRKIIALRNILVHEYEDINPEDIWEIVSVHLPVLLPVLKESLPPLPPDDTI